MAVGFPVSCRRGSTGRIDQDLEEVLRNCAEEGRGTDFEEAADTERDRFLATLNAPTLEQAVQLVVVTA